MKNIAKLLVALFLSFLIGSAMAGTISIPVKRPAVMINIPDSWEPEETDKGISCESPDQVATLFFEVASSEKGMNKLIDQNIDWLVKEQGVKIVAETQQEGETMVGGLKSSQISYDAKSKEFGPAKVGFIFTMVGEKLLVTTYWFSKKGYEKHDATVKQILESVRSAK